METVIDVPGLGAVRIAEKRLKHKNGRSTRHFWTADDAVLVQDEKPRRSGVCRNAFSLLMRHAHHFGHAIQQTDSVSQGLQQYVPRSSVPGSGYETMILLMRSRPGIPLAVSVCASDCGLRIAPNSSSSVSSKW
jgi:hypothetical protein